MPRITVCIRVKPEESSDVLGAFSHHSTQDGGTIDITANGSKHAFLFDHIFDENATQEEVFNKSACSVIDSVIEGFNGTLFAYGQTGAGKTHTVTGPQVESYPERGLCLRTVDYIFQSTRRLSSSRTYNIKMSVMEIYNDLVIDLLREGKENAKDPKLIIMDTPEGVVIPALYLFPIESEDEAYSKISEANINRAVAEHQLNRRSSRSHAIYSFYVTHSPSMSTVSDGSDVIQSKLHLVDLAGSERIEKTGSTGGLIKEATHINKSLSFLEQVVLSLTKNSSNGGNPVGGSSSGVASYRQSKLTYILKDSLGGNCNTLLIGCIWPHKNHVWETLSTLRFATRMKCIENHPQRNSLVTGNGSNSSTRSLQVTIEALKKELIMRDSIHAFSHQSLMQGGQNPLGASIVNSNSIENNGSMQGRGVYVETLTSIQQSASIDMACAYARQGGTAPSCQEVAQLEVGSLAQFQAVASTLRSALWLACGGNAERVGEVLDSMKASYDAGSTQTLMSPNRKPAQHQHTPGRNRNSSNTTEGDGRDDRFDSAGDSLISNVQSEGVSVIMKTPPRVNNDHGGKDGSDGVGDNSGSGGGVTEVNDDRVEVHVSAQLTSDNNNPGAVTQESTPPSVLTSPDSHIPNQSHTVQDPFEKFKQAEGSAYHAAYEEAKSNLKDLKARQKSLILTVNAAKNDIDYHSERVNELNSETIASLKESSADEIASLKVLLSEAKKEYRTKRSELLVVKEELAAGTLKKQELLKELVQAYEVFSAGTI